MYGYFDALKDLNNFKTYLIRKSYDKNRNVYVENTNFFDGMLKKLADLFKRLNILDILIMGIDENLFNKTLQNNSLSYDDWLKNNSFFQDKDIDYLSMKDEMLGKITLTSRDLRNLLLTFSQNINYLINFYPDYKEFLLSSSNIIKTILDEIETKSIIKVPEEKDAVIYKWPNSWYITPNGYLYNTGSGHQQGNLVYPFYHVICKLLENNREIPDINYNKQIKQILNRGYITDSEFQNYSHLIYKLPTVRTPEVEHDIQRYKTIMKMNNEQFEKVKEADEFHWPHHNRSYQKSLITLITGHLAAESALYSSFARMNQSCHKKELISVLNTLTRKYLCDVLVRYSGFSKIESTIGNTITTCSLNGIDEFSEYLNQGWNLHIIPGIIYDKIQDKLTEVDFNSPFVSRHLDRKLNEYHGNGKILIKDHWVK